MAAIFRTEQELRRVIEGVGIIRRKDNGHRPSVAVLLDGSVVAVGIERPLLDILHLVGAAVEPGDVPEVGAGVNDVRIARVDGHVAALASAHGVPVRAVDVAAVAGSGDTDGGIVLLRAIDAVRKIVVGGHVVELRGWLIPLRGPILTAVDRNGRAAVIAVDDAIGIVGIDPQAVVVAVGRIEAFECLAAVVRTEQAGVGDVDLVRILGVGPNVGEIPGALAKTVIVIDQGPVGATVIAAVEAAFLRFDERVDDIRIGAGSGHADAAEWALGHAVAFDALPGGTVVVRTVQAVLVTAAVERPGRAVAFPHRGEEDVGVQRIENDVDAAGAVVEVANVVPGFAAVVRTIDTIAERDVAANAGLARADVNHVGIGVGDRDATDGGSGLLIEERVPGNTAVCGFPNAAGDGAKIIRVRLAWNTSHG